MFLLVSFEQISNGRLKRVLGIRIVHKRTDTKQYLRNSQSRTPLILKNIQADVPRAADIAVIDLGYESNDRRLEWIVLGVCDTKMKHTSGIRTALRSNN
jgi:hypothetical protein